MTTDPELLRYLAAQDQRRADDVEQTLAAMTERERGLVREAAVMGYVLGAAQNAPGARIPADSHITRLVVASCRSGPTLFPVMSALAHRDEDTRDA